MVHEDQVESILDELHSGSCGAHSGGRSLAQRALTQGYWWLKMVKQSEDYQEVRSVPEAGIPHPQAGLPTLDDH